MEPSGKTGRKSFTWEASSTLTGGNEDDVFVQDQRATGDFVKGTTVIQGQSESRPKKSKKKQPVRFEEASRMTDGQKLPWMLKSVVKLFFTVYSTFPDWAMRQMP